MSVVVSNQYNFPQQLVDRAIAFPQGAYIEVDDMVFTMNGLGRKILQTHLVQVGGREVSVGNLNEGGAAYELILKEEKPIELGTFDTIIEQNRGYFVALQESFGGSISSYSHMEMVSAINRAKAGAVDETDADQVRKVAAWARIHTVRTSWVMKNRTEALLNAPLEWKNVGA